MWRQRLLIQGMIVVLTAVLGGPALADLSSFEKSCDHWPLWGTAQPVFERRPFTYTFDIRDTLDLAAHHRVKQAILDLDLTRDVWDWYDRHDFSEYVRVRWEDGSDTDLKEVDNGRYSLAVNPAWLNDDGLLKIKIDVYKGNNGILPLGEIWLDRIQLSGNAVVPVPGAILLGILGLSMAGLTLRRLT